MQLGVFEEISNILAQNLQWHPSDQVLECLTKTMSMGYMVFHLDFIAKKAQTALLLNKDCRDTQV